MEEYEDCPFCGQAWEHCENINEHVEMLVELKKTEVADMEAKVKRLEAAEKKQTQKQD